MRLLTFLFLFLCVSCGLFRLVSAKPQFLKEGFGATYTLETVMVITQMISNPDDPQDLGVEGALGQPDKNGTYSWQVTSLDGSDAIVDVHLDLPVKELDRVTYEWIPTFWNKTARITVDVDNREATALNGTSMGTINYWIDPSVEKGDSVSLYGKPPYLINETILNYLYNPVKTPAGEFDCWLIGVSTRVDLGYSLSVQSFFWYDKATGILVAAMGSYFDVVTMLMGIQQIEIVSDDFLAPAKFVLTSFGTSGTSIDRSFSLSDYLPHIFAATAAATIPVAVYIAKRTKRKHT